MRIIPVFLGAVLGAGVSLLAGCGTHMGNSLISNPPSNADFSLTASPSTLSLTAGATGQAISVTATALNGFTGSVSVSLSGLPAGVTASPSTLTLTPGAAQTLTLTAGSSAVAGTATITLTGTSGADSHTATVALTVTAAAAPDFSLKVTPASVDLTAGASGQTVAVTASAINGFTGNVSVSLAGLPTGVTATPSTLILTPGAPQNLTLTASTSAAGGMTPVTVTGTSGSLTHTAPIALTVTSAAPASDFSLTRCADEPEPDCRRNREASFCDSDRAQWIHRIGCRVPERITHRSDCQPIDSDPFARRDSKPHTHRRHLSRREHGYNHADRHIRHPDSYGHCRADHQCRRSCAGFLTHRRADISQSDRRHSRKISFGNGQRAEWLHL